MAHYRHLLILLLLPATMIFGQSINGRVTSSVYFFERADTKEASSVNATGYHYANLNLNYENFSLRTSLNADNFFNFDAPARLRVYNLYIESRKLFNIATVRIGRQPIFNSVLGGNFDGVMVDLNYSQVGLKAYYGGNVPAYQKLEFTDDLSNDFVLSGELSTSIIPGVFVAAGYTDKNFKTSSYSALRLDENFNPINVLIWEKSNQFKLLHGRLNIGLVEDFMLSTKYEYDLNYKTTSRVEANLVNTSVENLLLEGYVNYREPRVRYNSIFAVFDFANQMEYELGGTYSFNPQLNLFVRGGLVQYNDDNSGRITVGLGTSHGTVSYRKTFGYAGELDAISVYGAKSFFDGLVTPTVGITYASYKLSADSEKNDLLTFLAGVNFRSLRYLSFDIQAQYLKNKIYKDDLRAIFKVNYWFNSIL